jgi:hypothetical protein
MLDMLLAGQRSREQEAACLVGLLIDPEDGGSMFFRNFGKLLQDYKPSHATIQYALLDLQVMYAVPICD